MHPLRTVLSLSRPTIRDDRQLRRFVIRTTTSCVVLALCFDVANQLVFFETWQVALRSWAITVAVGIAIAAPVLFLMGRAYLELHRANEELELISRTDPLTGLLNRRALFSDDLDGPEVMALVIVDIDRFKRINDAHGHIAGDEVIRAVANMLSRVLADTGRIGRIGGEEFAILSADANAQNLFRRIEILRDRVADMAVMSQGITVSVTISAGLATRAAGQSFQDLYAAADRALYMAKAAGRNRVVLASDLPEAVPTRSANAPPSSANWLRQSKRREGDGSLAPFRAAASIDRLDASQQGT